MGKYLLSVLTCMKVYQLTIAADLARGFLIFNIKCSVKYRFGS